MKIGIIGSGPVGQVLAKAFKAEGYSVMIGTRDLSKENVITFSKENDIKTGTFQDVAKASDIIVLCTKGSAAENALSLAGAENLPGKIIIDTTNPIADAPPENGVLKFFTNINKSILEELQVKFPGAKFIKAFNSVGSALMYKPKLQGGKPSMFICGNDAGAKKTVTQILEKFGWDTEDMGTAEAARAIEPLCMLWCIPGFLQNDWMHAFKVLRP